MQHSIILSDNRPDAPALSWVTLEIIPQSLSLPQSAAFALHGRDRWPPMEPQSRNGLARYRLCSNRPQAFSTSFLPEDVSLGPVP